MDENEVIREIEVQITSELELFLLQFPLKPVYADPIDIQFARYKPVNKKLELDAKYPPNAFSASEFDLDDKMPVLQNFSSSVIAQGTCLAAGVINNDVMYLTPIINVLQMRPSFRNLHSKGEKFEAMEDEQNADGQEAPEGEEDGLQQVQLKRKESERAISARVHSFTYLQTQEAAESFKNLKVHEIGSSESEDIFTGKFSTS
eukprot:gene30606-39876_t